MDTLEEERRTLLGSVLNKAVIDYIVLISLSLGRMKESINGGADDQTSLRLNS